MIDRFLDERKASPRYRDTSRRWLELLLRFCQVKGLTLETLRPEHLASYANWLAWQPASRGGLYSPFTIAQILSVSRALLRWGYGRGLLPVDAGCELVVSRPPSPPLELPGARDVTRLFEVADAATPNGLRARAVLALVYYGELGAAECSGLELAQVSLRERVLRTERRNVTITDELACFVSSYLWHGRPAYGPRPGQTALLLGRGGTGISDVRVLQILRELGRQAGLSLRLSPRVLHRARRACGTC